MPDRTPKFPTAPVLVLGLSLAACAGGHPTRTNNPPPPDPEPTANPPAPEPEPPPVVEPTMNPPAPEPEPTEAAALPTWDEVLSGHPPGATNPPRPVLVVSPEGRCFKQWVSPMVPPIRHRDRIEPCEAPDSCGTEVVCPAERAAPLLQQLAERKEP